MFSQNASTASTRPAAASVSQPRAANLIDETGAVRGELARQRMQAQECVLDRHGELGAKIPRHLEHAPFGRELEPVAGL